MNERLLKITAEREMPLNFIRFYGVGLILFFIPATRGLFVWLTPLSLLLVIGVILYYHRNWNARTLGWFSFIILSSFLVEMAGVNTGVIFGSYRYGEGLGPKIYGTPLIIGLNWLFLTYSTHDIASRFFKNAFMVVPIGAGLMVIYDIVLEKVAPLMRMWSFTSAEPPLANYTVWFLLALVFHTGFSVLHIRVNNYPARMLFYIQLVFFLLILLFHVTVVV